MNRQDLRAGAVYYVGKDCGVPHTFRPILFRVITVDPRPTYDHMVWLDGYELDPTGTAVERRSIFVITAGLIDITATADARAARTSAKPTNAGPARIPRQRTTTTTATTTGRTR